METSPREWGEILYQTPWENRESEKRVNKMNFQSKSIHSCATGDVVKLWIGSVPFQQIKQRFWGLTFVTYSLSAPCYRHYNISVHVTGWKRDLVDFSEKGLAVAVAVAEKRTQYTRQISDIWGALKRCEIQYLIWRVLSEHLYYLLHPQQHKKYI